MNMNTAKAKSLNFLRVLGMDPCKQFENAFQKNGKIDIQVQCGVSVEKAINQLRVNGFKFVDSRKIGGWDTHGMTFFDVPNHPDHCVAVIWNAASCGVNWCTIGLYNFARAQKTVYSD